MTDPSPGAIPVILIDDSLFRRLPRETIRNEKVTRGACYFRGEPDPSISVDLARWTDPEAVRLRAQRPERFGVGRLPVQIPLRIGLVVQPNPLEDNPAHCLIEGATTKAICQSLADETTIVMAP